MKLSKAYNPADYEANTYALWETSGAFSPSGKGEPYSIVMPPPNANGNLHIGHALFVTIEDILTRYHRMRGFDTVWIPGADHAGFETWTVLEKSLEAKGDSRFNHTRDELFQMTWDFVDENRGKMEMQLRSLGASCDWDHQIFTLDRGVTDVVFTTFKKLWDDGLIYRGKRLVNYCTHHHTSFADIEVEYEEEKTPLYYMKYGPFTLATTRPETKFGDTAVAVHPDDERYKKWVGKTVDIEGVIGTFKVKVVADEMVDPDFGTGVVKITPAHSFDDWEVAQRHGLPAVQVIDENGRMMENTGRFAGMTVAEARKEVVKAMKEMGLIEKVDEDYVTNIAHCYKCGSVIEPMLKDQWFISVKPLAEKAIAAVKAGHIKFTPKQKGRELIQYYKELRDWNISRQIPWGISIPAFQSTSNPGDWIFDDRVDQTEIEVDGVIYKRDEDTFDTWFSSGQWPYITTHVLSDGSESDLKRFYPTAVMETGMDILRSWVARMVMLGLYVGDTVPFKEVYLHGLVNDEHNQKMSKSKGNVINPMTVVEEYGADAMRLGIIANRSAALSQAFSPATVVAGRNFCNKLWNIARYIDSVTPDEVGSENKGLDQDSLSMSDNWILRQLDEARIQVDKLIKEYRFAEAYEVIYHVIWDDVADWFIESSKVWNGDEHADDLTAIQAKRAEQGFETPLRFVLKYILKLAHPFAPFITETIWQSLTNDEQNTTLLITQQWPEKIKYSNKKATDFDQIIDIVREIRRANIALGGGKRTVYSDNKFIAENGEIISFLARVKKVETGQSGLKLNLPDYEAYIQASDSEIGNYEEDLSKAKAELAEKIKLLESRLANKSYVKNAPAHLVEETKAELAKLKASL